MADSSMCQVEEEIVEKDKQNNKASVSFGVVRRERSSLVKPYNAKRWTIEEDEKLKLAVQSIEGTEKWEKIADCVGRTIIQCQIRWHRVVHPYIVKGPWSKEEDAALTKWVSTFGPKKWWAISPKFPERNRLQCEERWLNHLEPKIKIANMEKSDMNLSSGVLVPQLEGTSLVSCPEAQQNSDKEGRMQQQANEAFEYSQDIANTLHSFIKEHYKAPDSSNLERSRRRKTRNPKRWTFEEDEKLKVAVQSIGKDKWKEIAKCLVDRTITECIVRWKRVVHPNIIKRPWSKEEDALLIKCVSRFGSNSWRVISQYIPERYSWLCEERWYNHLEPIIKKANKEKSDTNLASGGSVMQLEYTSLVSGEGGIERVNASECNQDIANMPHSFTSQVQVGIMENDKDKYKASDILADTFQLKRMWKMRNSRPWTPEEDEKLRMAVESIEGRVKWGKIAECLGDRHVVQCINRWRRVVGPAIAKGQWSKEKNVVSHQGEIRHEKGRRINSSRRVRRCPRGAVEGLDKDTPEMD